MTGCSCLNCHAPCNALRLVRDHIRAMCDDPGVTWERVAGEIGGKCRHWLREPAAKTPAEEKGLAEVRV